VQACCRALILDASPLEQQESANAWAGRMIGFGNVAGYFLGFQNLPQMMPALGNTQMKVLCVLAMFVFTFCVGVSCVTVKEEPIEDSDDDSNEKWYTKFVSIFKSIRYLPSPLQKLCNTQFFAWLGWFPVLFYR